MLQAKRLTNIEDLQRYAAIYYSKSSFRVSVHYLQRSDVWVFAPKNRSNKWMAGYVSNDNGALRYLSILPESTKAAIMKAHGMTPENVVEIGCMFLNSRSVTPVERAQFYVHMILKAFLTGKKFILGGAFSRKIQETQMKVLSHLIFEDDFTYNEVSGHVKLYYGLHFEILKKIAFCVTEYFAYIVRYRYMPQRKRALPA
jgi:hypothetical protein